MRRKNNKDVRDKRDLQRRRQHKKALQAERNGKRERERNRSNAAEEQNVVRMKAPKNINLGLLVFLLLFIYIIVLPFLFVYFSKLLKDEIENANMLPLLAIALGAASMTTMAALLLPLTLIAIFLVMGVYHRKIVGVRYLLAGLCGPGFQVIFYMLISLLLKEQQTWGKLWFG